MRKPSHGCLESWPRSGSREQRLVSELVRLECRVGPLRANNEALDGRFARFFGAHRPVLLSRAVFERATELRARYRLATPDALHVACAIEHGCEEFWTNDMRLKGRGLAIRIRASMDRLYHGHRGLFQLKR